MSSIQPAVYVAGALYAQGPTVIDALKGSGFTTIIGWAVHVHPEGTLYFNDTPVVVDGGYVGALDWPGLLAQLKQGRTSVDRLIFSVGGAGVGDFDSIKALIAEQGTGSTSILYRNFAALKSAIPTIDAIDLDDETTYDRDSTVAFCQMLSGLGYSITFCPYWDPDYWVGCLAALDRGSPSPVTGFNLQCYAGGGGNNPQDWIAAVGGAMGWDAATASAFVSPGLGSDSAPSDVEAQLSVWNKGLPPGEGLQGAFLWRYDDLGDPGQLGAYAAAIVQGLAPAEAAASATPEPAAT